jgi:hypothetical protein
VAAVTSTCAATEQLLGAVFSIRSLPRWYKEEELEHSCSSGKWIQERVPLGWGSLKNRYNKIYTWVPWDSDLMKAALAMPRKNWKVQTRLLVREGAPHQHTRNCKKKKSKMEWEKLVSSSSGCLIPRRTGLQTVGRNVTLTWLWHCHPTGRMSLTALARPSSNCKL